MRTTLFLIVTLNINLLACDRSERGRTEPSGPKDQPNVSSATQGGASSNAAVAQVAASGGVGAGGGGAGGMGGIGRLADDDPSSKFKGQARVELRGPREQLAVSLGTRGDRTRLRVERPGRTEPVTALLLGDDQLLLLQEKDRSFERASLRDVAMREEQEPSVSLDRTSERSAVLGLPCAKWRLSVNSEQVEACVHALPDKLDPDKLETALGLDLPPWVEKVVDEGYFPLQARVTTGGREAYRVELARYVPQEVSEDEMAAPAAFRELKPKSSTTK